MANSVNPDQTALSDLGVHRLPMYVCSNMFALSMAFFNVSSRNQTTKTSTQCWGDNAMWPSSHVAAQMDVATFNWRGWTNGAP